MRIDRPEALALPRDMGAIQAVVCSQFGVTKLELVSQRRSPHLVRARHAAFWLAHLSGYQFTTIAAAFERNPTTVARGVSRALLRKAADHDYAVALAALAAPFGWATPLPPVR